MSPNYEQIGWHNSSTYQKRPALEAKFDQYDKTAISTIDYIPNWWPNDTKKTNRAGQPKLS